MIIDEDRAKIVLATALKTARELGDVVRLLEDDGPELKAAIASIVYDIMENVVTPVLDAHPSLKANKG